MATFLNKLCFHVLHSPDMSRLSLESNMFAEVTIDISMLARENFCWGNIC